MFVYTFLVLSQWRHHTVKSPDQITSQCPSSMACYQSGLVAPLLKWPHSFVVNLYSNALHENGMDYEVERESNLESFSGRWWVQDEGAYIVWQWNGH